MNQVKVPLFLIALVVLPVTSSPVAAQNHEDSLKKRFLEEAPPRWEEYRRLVETVQGTLTCRARVISSKTQLNQNYQIEYKSNKNGRLVIEQSLAPSDSTGKVYGFNPHYFFILQRKSQKDSWTLTRLERPNGGKLPEDLSQPINRYFNALTALTNLRSESLQDVVRKPNFKVQRVLPVLRDGEELLEVLFEYPHILKDLTQKDYNPIQGGSMVLDPKRYWCVRALNLNLKTSTASGKSNFQVEIDDLNATLPLPKRYVDIEDFALNSQERFQLTTESKLSLSKPSQLPSDEEFTLSAFGLPEPLGMTRSKTIPCYLWLSLGGALCLVVGGVFYWLKRRVAGKTN